MEKLITVRQGSLGITMSREEEYPRHWFEGEEIRHLHTKKKKNSLMPQGTVHVIGAN